MRPVLGHTCLPCGIFGDGKGWFTAVDILNLVDYKKLFCAPSDNFLSFSLKWYSETFCFCFLFFCFYRNSNIPHIFNTIFLFATLVEMLFSSLWQLSQSGTWGCLVQSVLYCLDLLARQGSQHFTQTHFYCLFHLFLSQNCSHSSRKHFLWSQQSSARKISTFLKYSGLVSKVNQHTSCAFQTAEFLCKTVTGSYFWNWQQVWKLIFP